jgi:aryl-alcohol dehydrogenase-like predicted oxidoreductase
MEYRDLGSSGLRVSALGLGTGAFTTDVGAPRSVDLRQARALVDRALDGGINFFDTADVYGDGRAEEVLGAVLRGRRDRAVIATKLRFRAGPGPGDQGLSRTHVLRSADASLRRLGTDHIDLYQMHGWDGLTPVEETLDAMAALMKAGKIRHIGASNFSGWHLMTMLAAADRGDLPRLAAQQIHYTPYTRDAEHELLPIAIAQDLGVLVWSPLAGGLLSGRFRRKMPPPQGGRRLEDYDEPPIDDGERLYTLVDVLAGVAADHEVSVPQVCLAYELTRPSISSLIVGPKTVEHLADNLAVANLALADVEIDRIETVSRRPLPYPYWHQAKTITDRLTPADRVPLSRHIDRPLGLARAAPSGHRDLTD